MFSDARNVSANRMSVRIDDDILPCTNYTFEVAAVTVKGPGPYSNLSVTTSTRGNVDLQTVKHARQIRAGMFDCKVVYCENIDLSIQL